MKKISDVRVVATSFIVSVSDVVLNFTIAFFTGSAVMLAQGLQGMSDLTTSGILYVGVKRSKRKADKKYQFGYGREIFFWVLMAGIFMFLGTGGASVYFGYQQFIDPQPVVNAWIALLVLLFGMSTNGYAFSLSVIRLRKLHHGFSWWHQLLRSSVAETKATFLIDFLGTTSAVIGFIALGVLLLTSNPVFDGLGAMAVGLSMMAVSVLLIRDVRDLIIGKAVEPDVARRIINTAESVPGVLSVLDLKTMYIGSARILVILEVHLRDKLETDEIERITDDIKSIIRQNITEVQHIQVEIETPENELGRLTSIK